MHRRDKSSTTVRLLRWAARLTTILAIALIVAMQLVPDPETGGFAAPTIEQAVLALFMPGLTLLGFLLAWRWEALGGAVMVAAFPLFVLAVRVLNGRWIQLDVALIMWALLALPGVLFMLCAWLDNRPKPDRPSSDSLKGRPVT